MADLNATLPLLQPMAETITNLTSTLSWLLGGFVGLYLITFVFKAWLLWKILKRMTAMEDRLIRMEKRLLESPEKGKK